MAVSPLATEQNTISYRELMKIPVGDRVAAASSTDFLNQVLNGLTPIQIANLFPDYYKRRLPDISGFILANRYLDAGGRFNQYRGGQEGYAPDMYNGEVDADPNKRPVGTPEPTMDEMKRQLLNRGIDVDNLYENIDEDGVLEGDERLKHVKKLSDEELARSGLQRVETEDGKTLIKKMSPDSAALSDEEVLKKTSGKVAKGTGNLEGKQKLQKQVYDSFINAGFSDNQAKALTAEVGRENDYSEKFVFGKHVDANNSKVNLGFFSWQGSRGKILFERMKEKGLIDGNGAIVNSQESLNEMALFAKDEMENNPEYKRTKKQFLDNPDITQQEAAEVLGNNYIRWDMAGKKIDPGPHMRKRDEYYNQIGEINNKFPGIIPENATPDQIAAARNELIAQEKVTEAEQLTKILYDKDSPTSSDVIPGKGNTPAYANPGSMGTYSYKDDSEQFGIKGTAEQRGLDQVDPRIVEIMEKTAKEFPLRVRLFSGKRDSGGHGAGVATDIQIFDEAGNPLGSYQTPQTANIYAMYALKAREIQMRDYPELNDKFVWGGAWPGMNQSGGGKYGAADWMDFRIGHSSQDTMKAFKWPDSEESGKGGWQKGYEHYTENDFLGIGNRTPTAEDFEKLKGFRLSEEQMNDQYLLAQRIGANAGLLSHENIGPRKLAEAEYVAPGNYSVLENQQSLVSVVPNTVNPNLPGGQTATANKQDIKGVVFHKPGLSLEELKAGSDPRDPSFGYNTAIVSTYVDESGNTISEQEWKRLPKSKQSSYSEKAEVHQLRPEDVRPNQMKASDSAARTDVGRELNNTNALGIVTIGQDSPAKQEASQKYLAQLIADGKMSSEALSSVYGHGETQPDEGRGTMDPGKAPEGSVAANAVRSNTDKIMAMAEDLKQKRTEQAAAQSTSVPTPETTESIPGVSNGGTTTKEETETLDKFFNTVEAQSDAEYEVPKLALGGFIPEKDNLTVMKEGKQIAKINEGELHGGISQEGTGLRVESNKKRLAESLVDKNQTASSNDTKEPSYEPEDKQSEIRNEAQMRQGSKPEKNGSEVMKTDFEWREKMASASHQIGTQGRAFRRTKFMSEGYHFNRATPGSMT